MSLKVRELHHQAIRVPPGQAGEVQGFYEDVLGMETDPNRPDVPVPGAWMNVGGAQIHIVGVEGTSSFASSPERDPTRPHVALAVDSLTEARSELERLGVKYWELDIGTGGGRRPAAVRRPRREHDRDPSDGPVRLPAPMSPGSR